jgi:exonuclease SbcC
MARQQTRLETMENTLAARAEIESGYTSLIQARQADQDFNQRLREQADLSQQQSRWEQAVAEERARLQAEQSRLSQQMADLGRTIAEGVSDDMLRDVRAQIEALEARQTERDERREHEAALNQESATLEADNRALKRDLDALDVQLDQIKAVQEPVCPLCGQPLDAERREELVVDFERRRAEKTETWHANRARQKAIKEEIAGLKRTIEALSGELRGLPPLQQHEARLADRDRRAREAQEDIESVRAELAGIQTTLTDEGYALEARAALETIQTQLAALGYDESAHQAARVALETYEEFGERKAELDRALQEIPEVSESIGRLANRAATWDTTLAEDRARLEQLSVEIERLDAQVDDMAHWEHELNQARDEEGRARYRVGAAQQKLRALEQQRNRRVELTENLAQLGEEQSIYRELRTAFGKDGVPAMLIEAAIPEIEESANQILAGMTDAQMRIRFETQKELISTERVTETLEIKITDKLGARDYELYSGGEAFRVNFAIRVALSRLLARRAGAQLRTLFIDEGFGTQDAQGRERLVQAINAIQDDFDLVLVITHVDELKDAFPARIEVTKTPDGSMIELA